MPASAPADLLALLRDVNRKAAFNLCCGIEVLTAETGRVEIGMGWKPDLGQCSGFLHAGLVGALIDTACELLATSGAEQKIVATGETLLTVLSGGGPG